MIKYFIHIIGTIKIHWNYKNRCNIRVMLTKRIGMTMIQPKKRCALNHIHKKEKFNDLGLDNILYPIKWIRKRMCNKRIYNSNILLHS